MRHNVISKKKKASKYKAIKTKRGDITFDSIKEAVFFDKLNLLLRSGQVVMFLRQVPFDLPGGVKYRLDFQVFYSDGTVEFIDVKGVQTKEFIMKKKMVESIYPMEIKLV